MIQLETIFILADSNSAIENIDVWYHIALTRSGDTFRYFLDGVLVQDWEVSPGYQLRIHSNGLTVGAYHDGDYINPNFDTFKGYIEELRVLKGTAAWVSDFPPPTTAY